ncbi:50S ribosomal protein L21 [Morus notabilis]|uniref:Large ribosomal subunit protein bL21m n=1 Tax=Morus notabilis TaxID=981085 RepID=W9S9K8_9ROSA|nr:50S ribosomal protein L21, mitochondrial [Morus notabilis]EXC18110.1 50S ribosomal protein L21 [Morus notabilis]
MATRRCLHSLIRQASALLYRDHASVRFLATPLPRPNQRDLGTLTAKFAPLSANPGSGRHEHRSPARHFSSNRGEDDGDTEDGEEDDDDDDDDEEEVAEFSEDEDVENVSVSISGSRREYSPEEKAAEAAAIGYKVIGPLEKSDNVFKPYEPVFAVVQIGSHQFKASNGDCIFTEKLKFCEVNDKLLLNKVLLLGSRSQTIVGRPIVPDAAVHAVVEEHALDAKVLIFKKKRRKNYRRTKGHRQELTKLRITDIQGIEKPEPVEKQKPPKTPGKKQEKVAVAA